MSYLARYGIAVGYTDGLFHGDEPITRAEFTAMAVRFFDAYGDGDPAIMEEYGGFWDVSPGHWAAGYIEDAARYGWVVATVTAPSTPTMKSPAPRSLPSSTVCLGVRLTRSILPTIPVLVVFPDVSKGYWAYYDILEAANHHEADVSADPEVWQK